jgi:hypothetical protein
MDFFIGITFTIKNAEKMYTILLKKEIHQVVSLHRLFTFIIETWFYVYWSLRNQKFNFFYQHAPDTREIICSTLFQTNPDAIRLFRC